MVWGQSIIIYVYVYTVQWMENQEIQCKLEVLLNNDLKMSISADASMRSQFNSLPVQSGYSTTSNTAMTGREFTSNSEPQSSKSV